MTIVYSSDDTAGLRWSGVGRPLTPQEVNFNFYQHETRLGTLEAAITTTVSIGTITQPSPSTLLFTMTDSTTQGPFTLPVSTFQDRGTWQPSTVYVVNDTFTANGSLYRVLFDHTSASTFSPTANDGAGHDYYASMMSSPGNALPTGGATGQVLQKSSGSDFAVTWGYKLPTGGTADQVLLKQSSTNQAAVWTKLSASKVSFAPSTGSALTATDVATALEQAALLGGSGGASALAGLSDVHFATGQPADGDLLFFSGAFWVSLALSSLTFTTAQLRNPTVTTLGTTGTVSLDPSLGNVFTITPTGNVTLNAASTAHGAEITLIITTSGTSSFNITPNSNFKSQGVLATGTVDSKVFTMKFVGDGGIYGFVEVSRTAAM